jgi:hypothetical protein
MCAAAPQAAAGVAGSPHAAHIGWARAAADLRVVPADEEPWPAPPQDAAAPAAAARPAAPRGLALRLGLDVDGLASTVCPARAAAAASAAAELAARLQAGRPAGGAVGVRADATSGEALGDAHDAFSASPAHISDEGRGPPEPGGSALEPPDLGPGHQPAYRVQWEAALQLGGASSLRVLPAAAGPALRLSLASAEAHAASGEADAPHAGGARRRAAELLPPLCGGLSMQVSLPWHGQSHGAPSVQW